MTSRRTVRDVPRRPLIAVVLAAACTFAAVADAASAEDAGERRSASAPSERSRVSTTAPPGICPSTHHGAAVDQDAQRAWLCVDGIPVDELPVTGAITQPDAGTYAVFAKDAISTSTTHGRPSSMTHFVAFTYGKYRGARIAFHAVPTFDSDGALVQPLSTVGDLGMRGESGGCFRVLPVDAERIWSFLEIGDEVRVLN